MNQQPPMGTPKPAVSKWLWIALIVVAVAAAGFFSWYYLMGPGKKVATSTTTTPTTTSTTPSTTTTTPTTTTPSIAPDKVANAFYDLVLSLNNTSGMSIFESSTKPYKLKSTLTKYLTTSLTTTLESKYNTPSTGGGADYILCAQDVPSQITYTIQSNNGSTATVIATENFAGSPKITLGLNVVGSEWKINSITCPQP